MRTEKRILIVDDDDAIRALLTTVLRKRGAVVDSARNGAEALEKLAACRYSLMVLDLMMPIASGYDVLEQLGEMSGASRPIVLVLTAGLEARRFDTSFVVATMAKPFDIEMLVSTITSCLEVSDAHAQVDHCAEQSVKAAGHPDEVN